MRRALSVTVCTGVIMGLMVGSASMLAADLGQQGAAVATSPEVTELLARFQAELVFWKQAEIGEQFARVAGRADLKPLEPWLTHEDRHIRGNVAYLIAKLGDRRGFDVLVGILRDFSPQRAISPPVAITGPMSTGTTYEEWLADYRNSVQGQAAQIRSDRYYAVHLLGQLRDRRAIPVLLPLLEQDEVNYKVAWALGQIGDRQAIPPLIRSLQGARDTLFQTSLINALETLKATEALPDLEALFDSKELPRAGTQVSVGTTARKAAEAIRGTAGRP